MAEIAGFHNDQISEISITGADPTSSVQSPSRSEEISGPVIVSYPFILYESYIMTTIDPIGPHLTSNQETSPTISST